MGLSSGESGSASATLAMVGLGEVGKLKINCECLGDAIGVLNRERPDDFSGLSHQAVIGSGCSGLFTFLNQESSQLLDYIEKCFALLLHQHTTEKGAK